MQTESTKRTEAKRNGKAKAAPKAKTPSKPSTVDSPVKVVRELAERMKGAKRAEVIKAAVARGVNKWTASTQYRLWRKPPESKR